MPDPVFCVTLKQRNTQGIAKRDAHDSEEVLKCPANAKSEERKMFILLAGGLLIVIVAVIVAVVSAVVSAVAASEDIED